MRVWLLIGMLLLSGVAVAQSATVESDEFHVWLKARIKKAKAGERELVRVPMVKRADNWGCECPFTFIGLSTVDFAGGAWVDDEYLPGVESTPYRSEGSVSVVEGYFTGVTNKTTYEGGDTVTSYVLKISKVRPFMEDSATDDDAVVLLTGEEAKKEVIKLTDERPWLVLIKSLPLLDKNLEKKKTDALKKLTDAGYSSAEVLDSRQTNALNCCYAVVIAGRFATEAEAKTALKEVKKKFKGSYVKKGW